MDGRPIRPLLLVRFTTEPKRRDTEVVVLLPTVRSNGVAVGVHPTSTFNVVDNETSLGSDITTSCALTKLPVSSYKSIDFIHSTSVRFAIVFHNCSLTIPGVSVNGST